MPKVLISDKMDPKAAQIFRERGVEVDEITGKTPAELIAIIGQYDGLAIRSSTRVTKEILEHATNLKVVGRAGIGVDNVDIPAASAKGVVVMNTPFGNSITTAEHAIALMFALARQLPEADASTQAGKWEKNRFMGVELTSKTLGLIGAGNIGSIVADRARGLKMRVIAFDRLACLHAQRGQHHRIADRLFEQLAQTVAQPALDAIIGAEHHVARHCFAQFVRLCQEARLQRGGRRGDALTALEGHDLGQPPGLVVAADRVDGRRGRLRRLEGLLPAAPASVIQASRSRNRVHA